MSAIPSCPKCQSELAYKDGLNFVCPECAHEWPQQQNAEQADASAEIKDAFGNVLKDGDSVSVI
ncbi:MAG TPA: alkylphosphonate utilization protein, partial [Steroidobacteraceae bacterium]|nr:alkylphosphonate utilization protein [Steroidobacteraceae bacterium]